MKSADDTSLGRSIFLASARSSCDRENSTNCARGSKLFAPQIDPSGFDSGEIRYVIYQCQQVMRRFAYVTDIVAVSLPQRPLALLRQEIRAQLAPPFAKGGVSWDVLRRTCRIYFYQCALLAVAFTLVAEVALRFHLLALENLLSFYLQSPKQAVIAAALLDYCPSLMDILPMYIVFMLLTPIARKIARSLGWETVLFVSFMVWAGAQFGLRAWVYHHSDFFGLRVPESSTGAFDLYGWQLLWMIGLALGSKHAESLSAAPSNVADSDSRMPSWLVRLSCMVVATFLVLRYAPADHWMNAQVCAWLIDKWRLGAARLIDFAAIALLLVRFGDRVAGLALFRPLASLGKASIQVFSVQMLFCVAGQALSKEANPELPWWEQGILLSATISALFITAHLANKRSCTNAWGTFWPRHNSERFQRSSELQLDRA